MPFDVTTRHALTPTALLGGSSSVTTGVDPLKRAKNSERPKVLSPGRHHGDHILTRTGRRGGVQLQRLMKSLAPKVQGNGGGQVQQGGGGQVEPVRTTGNAQVTPPPLKPPKVVPPPVPPKPFALRMQSFERRLSEMRSEVRELRYRQPDPLSTRKERAKAETAMSEGQLKLKGEVDKALGEVSKFLAEKKAALRAAQSAPPPVDDALIDALNDEITQLAEMRRDFIAMGIGADFTALAELNQDPLPKGGVVAGLWSCFREAGDNSIERDYLIQRLGVQGGQRGGMAPLELANLIDAFNAGRPITKNDGTQLSPAQFQRYVDDLATTIGELCPSEEGRKTVAELKALSAQINAKMEFAEAVVKFEAAIDKFNATYKPLPPPNVDPFKNGFPLSSAMQVISSAFPHSREFGNSRNMRQVEAAAASVAHFAEMIARGETTPALHGLDLNFDKAMLPMKQETGAERAVEKLRQDRAKGPLPSSEMIALLDKEESRLTEAEKASMLALVQHGVPSLAGAREILAQAREDIRIARALGGDKPDEAEQNLRAERARGPLPSDDLIALLDKPDDQLTDGQKAALLALVEKPQPTLAEARLILQAAKEDITKARHAGAAAARMRHEFTLMDKKLSRLLTVRPSTEDSWKNWRGWPWNWGSSIKSALYTPNSWGAGQTVASTLAGVRIDAQFMKGLHAQYGENAGKEVAILTARFAYMQRQTVLQEQQALGLHRKYDVDNIPLILKHDTSGTPYVAGFYQQVDPNNPLGHFGISNQDLTDIGLTPAEIRDVGQVVERLSRQGVASLEEVQDVTTAMNDVSKIVLRSELIHDTVVAYENDKGRVQGLHLLHDILVDADLNYRKENNVSGVRDERQPINTDDDEVAGHFLDRSQRIERALGGQDGMELMRSESDSYRRLETTMARVYRDHMAIDDEIARRRGVIENARTNLGITVDPDDPRGLRSAKQILIALDAQAVIDRNPDPTSQETLDAYARRRDALEALRGFNTKDMTQSWSAKAFNKISDMFGARGGKVPDIDELRNLREVAEAIVYVRETGPMGNAQLEQELSHLGTVIDGFAEMRSQRDPGAMAHVRTMIRAAVLAEWRTAKTDMTIDSVDPEMVDYHGAGGVSEGFDPSLPANRQKIEATLTSWGLDIEAFSPEIDSVVYSRMTPDDIAMWRQETQFSEQMIERMRDDRPFFNLDRIIGRRTMDTQARGALLAMIEGFQDGDKLDLKAGQRVTVDTNRIPIEPSGLGFVRARLAGAHIGQFEIEMGSDGLKLHVRTGGEVRGNFDVGVGKKFGKDDGLGENIEARLEASVGLEGSTSRLTGMTVTFDKDAKGKEALIALVAKMIDGEPITARDWDSALDVGYTYENRAKGGVNARAEGRIAFGGKPDPHKSTGSTLDDEFVGVGGVVSTQVGGAIGGKWVGTDSLNQVTRKSEVEVSTTFNVSAGIYAQFWNVMNMGTGAMAQSSGGQEGAAQLLGEDSKGKPLYNITSNVNNYDLVNVGMTATATAVRKWKMVKSPDGRYTGAEMVRQSTGSSGPVASFAACLDTPQMKAILSSDKNKAFKKELETFMKLKGPSDHIAVTYAPKPGVIDRANALVTRAIAARRDGNVKEAEMFEAAAEQILYDNNNYMPTKIGLITTDVQKREDTIINARWIKWDTFSDGKSEHRGIVLNIPTA